MGLQRSVVALVWSALVASSWGWTARSTVPGIRRCRRALSILPSNADGSALATKAPPFVNGEMRPYAMSLHTKDQAKEGERKAQKAPLAKWSPTLEGYLQFLTDSRHVYRTLEKIVAEYEELVPLRGTGLERGDALDADIQWLCTLASPPLQVPPVGKSGRHYAEVLEQVARESVPQFTNHFYNYYFAHSAGGRMIGRKMADALLDGRELEFYKWEGDVKELLGAVSESIDELAATWTAEERQACLEETARAFQLGGALLGYLKE